MGIDRESLQNKDREWQKLIRERIEKIYETETEIINSTKCIRGNLGLEDVKIPNIGITISNKLLEISNTFKKQGMFLKAKEDETIQAIVSPFVGDAIIYDLIQLLNLSVNQLEEYKQETEKTVNRRDEKIQAITNIHPIKRFFSKIKSLFIPVRPIDISVGEEEKDALDKPLREYKNLNEEIYNYNLEENVISSIVKYIPIYKRSFSVSVLELMKREIIPDLEQLGLSDLIPYLQSILAKEYKEEFEEYKEDNKLEHINETEEIIDIDSIEQEECQELEEKKSQLEPQGEEEER